MKNRLRKILSYPPKEIILKSFGKIYSLILHFFSRLYTHFFSTYISDRDFSEAIMENSGSKEKFIAEVRKNKSTKFFVSRDNQDFLMSTLRMTFQRSEQKTIEKANEVCNHMFDLLGSGLTFLGNPINWHLDFIYKKAYPPRKYYKDFTPANYPGGHDIKVPWELSRCQHFTWLGQAYWFTKDERYAEEFVQQVNDWIEKNPPRLGVNWVTAMEVAIRAVNWLWGYYFFIDSPHLTDEFLVKFFKSILYHGRHIMNNLETSGVPNNHYLSNLVGLLYLGILIPQFKESEKWLLLAKRELESEIRKQIRDDGVDFESSTSYHRLVTEIFVSAAILAKLNGHLFSKGFHDRLEKMIEFLMHITKPDGTSPLLGDIDNGRLHRLKIWEEAAREWVDYRYLLAIGAVLFNRADFADLAGAGDQWEEAFWLFGHSTLSFRNEGGPYPKVSLASHAFQESGIYVSRTNDMYMLVNAGPIVAKKTSGHSHNDVFSFELFANNQTWIIDPGTYVYTPNQVMRNRFRSTGYHSTVVVDGQEINRINKVTMFELNGDAKSCHEKWITGNEFDYLRVSHDGYKRLTYPVIHHREFFFDKVEKLCLICDTFTGKGNHTLEWNWPIPPGITIIELEKSFMLGSQQGGQMKFHLPSNDEIDISITEGMISPSYGSLIKGATFIKLIAHSNIPITFQFAFTMNCDDSTADIDRMYRSQKTFNNLEKE